MQTKGRDEVFFSPRVNNVWALSANISIRGKATNFRLACLLQGKFRHDREKFINQNKLIYWFTDALQ